MIYPTPNEIISPPLKHRKEVITAMEDWKPCWLAVRKGTDEEKIECIRQLVEALALLYETQIYLRHEPEENSHYDQETTTIVLDKPSIISALHELAHHLFGPNEKKACRWSVQLFQKTFPRAFAQLEWQGHLLVKKESN